MTTCLTEIKKCCRNQKIVLQNSNRRYGTPKGGVSYMKGVGCESDGYKKEGGGVRLATKVSH